MVINGTLPERCQTKAKIGLPKKIYTSWKLNRPTIRCYISIVLFGVLFPDIIKQKCQYKNTNLTT